jgi:hypothetical protein
MRSDNANTSAVAASEPRPRPVDEVIGLPAGFPQLEEVLAQSREARARARTLLDALHEAAHGREPRPQGAAG